LSSDDEDDGLEESDAGTGLRAVSPVEDELPAEVFDGFDGDPPMFDGKYDESEKENVPSGCKGRKRKAGGTEL
jgi:hypothetical protein